MSRLPFSGMTRVDPLFGGPPEMLVHGGGEIGLEETLRTLSLSPQWLYF